MIKSRRISIDLSDFMAIIARDWKFVEEKPALTLSHSPSLAEKLIEFFVGVIPCPGLPILTL